MKRNMLSVLAITVVASLLALFAASGADASTGRTCSGWIRNNAGYLVDMCTSRSGFPPLTWTEVDIYRWVGYVQYLGYVFQNDDTHDVFWCMPNGRCTQTS